MGGGGDGGGGGPKRPDSGEMEAVDISPTIIAVHDRVNGDRELNLKVDTPILGSGVEWQDNFRRQFFDSPEDFQHLREIQQMDRLAKVTDYEDYYRFLAHTGTYHGGRIALENFAAMLGFDRYRSLDDVFRKFVRVKKNGSAFEYKPSVDADGHYEAGNIVELGPGNGDLIRRLARYKRGSEPLKRMRREISETSRRISKRQIYDMLQKGRERLAGEIDEGEIDLSISAIDYIGAFSRKLRQSKINGVKANLEDPTELFLSHLAEANIRPHSQDVIAATLLADRIDIQQLAQKIHLLSRLDGMTRVFFAQTFPLDRESDNDTKQENVARIPNWTSADDIREKWTHSATVDDEFRSLGDEEAVRAQGIFNAVRDLKDLGIEVYAIGEQPYEVYSAHCIVETAETIRKEYGYLHDRKFMNPDLQRRVDAIFRADSPIADDQLVGIPQEYRLTMFAARVKPFKS